MEDHDQWEYGEAADLDIDSGDGKLLTSSDDDEPKIDM